MASYLSNHWHDLTVMKLDTTHEGEGPFVLYQDAIDANDARQLSKFWMLRADGKWIDQVTQYSLEPAERIPVWFSSIREVMELLATLPEHPVIFTKKLTPEQKAISIQEITNSNLETIREHVRTWKVAHQA